MAKNILKDFAGLEAAGSVLQECGKKQLATDRGELIHDWHERRTKKLSMIFTRPAWPAGPRMAVDFAGLRRNWHNRGSVGKKCRLRTATCTLCFSATMKMKTLKIRNGGTHLNLSYSFQCWMFELSVALRNYIPVFYKKLEYQESVICNHTSSFLVKKHWSDFYLTPNVSMREKYLPK